MLCAFPYAAEERRGSGLSAADPSLSCAHPSVPFVGGLCEFAAFSGMLFVAEPYLPSLC